MKSIKYVECVIQSMYACHQPQLLSNEHRH